MIEILQSMVAGDLKPEQRRTIYMVGWRLIVAVHISWACGLLEPIGVHGFAWSADLNSVKTSLDSTQSEILEGRIFDDVVRQCTAETSEARRFYGQRVIELMARYKKLTGNDYARPTCTEI